MSISRRKRNFTFLVCILLTIGLVLPAMRPVEAGGLGGQGISGNVTLDPAFDGDGLVVSDLSGGDEYAYAMALQPDGKILMAGFVGVIGGQKDIALARYNPDGTLDTTFSEDGWASADIGFSDEVYGLALQADGKVVVVGSTFDGNETSNLTLVRFNPDGTLDTTFGVDGVVTSVSTAGFAVALQGDGKIVVCGVRGGDFLLARFTLDGSPDTTFDSDGWLTTDFGNTEFGQAVALQADGKILAGGYTYYDIYSDFALARYNTDGSLDTSFSSDGKVITDFSGGSDKISDVTVQPNGMILAVGYAVTDQVENFALARYTPDGELDASFDGDGMVTTAFPGTGAYGEAVALQPDGKIVVAGWWFGLASMDFALARYNSNGSLDATFDEDGKLTTDFGGSEDEGLSIALQGDGKIVIGGYVVDTNIWEVDFALARYLVEGEEYFTIISIPLVFK
ncbi:MAG: hypothetical protein JW726_16235 [Anaerolineales bacterium]|nr:hypothetical protein [Anaerolineales bacterium]